jgi:hypothetical protein
LDRQGHKAQRGPQERLEFLGLKDLKGSRVFKDLKGRQD